MASFHFTRRLTHISVEPRFIFSCYTYATCGQLCVTTRVAPSLSNDSPACIYIYIYINGLTHLVPLRSIPPGYDDVFNTGKRVFPYFSRLPRDRSSGSSFDRQFARCLLSFNDGWRCFEDVRGIYIFFLYNFFKANLRRDEFSFCTINEKI